VKKLLKIALIAVGAMVVLVTAAALLIPRLVDPNQYKGRISALVAEKTGRDLTITGDISLSVFPWLGAEIGGVKLGNAPGFEANTFAAVQQVKVKVKLLPLLSRKVEAGVITVEGLALNLERNPDGSTNWEDLSGAPAAPQEKPETDVSESPALGSLAVGGLDIRNARISWTDRQSDTAITVKNLGVKTSAVNLADPVVVSVRCELDTGALGLAGIVDTGARIELDLSGGRYTARDLSLTADLTGDAIPGGSASIILQGNAAFDAGAGAFDLDGIRLEAAGLNLAGYTAEALVEASGAGDLTAGTIRMDNLMATAALIGAEEKITAELSTTAEADLNARRFKISNLTLDLPDFSMKGISGSIQSTSTGSATADLAEGTVTLDAPALAGTLSGAAVPGGGAPVALALGIQGNLNQKTFTARPVVLSVADMTATANLDLAQAESGPRFGGALSVAPFNLRNLLERLGVALPDMADAGSLSEAEISLNLFANDRTAAVDGLSIRLDDTTLTGALVVNSFETPETSFDLALDRIRLERYLPPGGGKEASKLLSDITLKGEISADTGFRVFQAARLAIAGKLDKKLAFGLEAKDARGDLDNEVISVDALSLNAGKMALQARTEVTGFKSTPAFTASIQSKTFNLRQLLSDLDLMPETADARAMSAVKLNTALEGTPDAISISSLELRLDDTNITGNADVTLSPAPAYAFSIAVDSINADRYLPPTAPLSATKGRATQTPTPATTPLPVEFLRGLALDGNITIGKLKIKNLNLSNIELQAGAGDGLLTITPLGADLYEGALGADIRLDARGQRPDLSVSANLAGVQSGKLLKDLQGKAVVTGLASADLDLAAAGADTGALLSSLGGTVSFTFTDGSIQAVDIVGKLCNTLMAVDAGTLKAEDLVGSGFSMLTQKITGTQATDTMEEADSTRFSELAGSMGFDKGVGTSEDLSLKSPMLRVTGAGALDLPKQALDYDATAYLVKSCQGQGGKGTSDLKNIPIPVTISGPLTELKVKPNLTAGIMEVLAREQRKKQEETAAASEEQTEADTSGEAPQTVEETVEEAVTGILKDLLN
jgi:AsmA protein